MQVTLTVDIEYLCPDNQLVINPNHFITQFFDLAPKLEALQSHLRHWFSDEIETEPTLVQVWCNDYPHPTILRPKNLWNKEAVLIVPPAVSGLISGSLSNYLVN